MSSLYTIWILWWPFACLISYLWKPLENFGRCSFFHIYFVHNWWMTTSFYCSFLILKVCVNVFDLVLIHSTNVSLLTELMSAIGHYVLISGYDAATDEFEIWDPASSRYRVLFSNLHNESPSHQCGEYVFLCVHCTCACLGECHQASNPKRSIPSSGIELNKEKS